MDESDDYEALPDSSPITQHMFAGACAGIMEHAVMYPFDCVKTRMQCIRPLSSPSYRSAIDGVYRLIHHEGIIRSMRGVGAMVGGAGPAHAVYFGCYEQIKYILAESSLGRSYIGHSIAGACATLLHDAVMTPADAIKQRLQIYNSPYHNSLDCLKRVWSTEGPLVLYRAYFTQLSMNIPYQAIHFVCYEHAQATLNPTRKYLPWTHLLSGALAGCMAAASTNPFDVCKTLLNTQDGCLNPTCSDRFKSQSTVQIRGLMDSARFIYSVEGMRGFTRGMNARILTAMPGTALSWSVYEYFKWRLKSTSNQKFNKPPPPSGGGDLGPDMPKSDLVLTNSARWFPSSNEVACASSLPSSIDRDNKNTKAFISDT